MVRSATLSVESWACHRVILGCAGNHGDPIEFLSFDAVLER